MAEQNTARTLKRHRSLGSFDNNASPDAAYESKQSTDVKRLRSLPDNEKTITYFPEPAIWINHIFKHMIETCTESELRFTIQNLRLVCKTLHQMIISFPSVWNPCFTYKKCIDYLQNALRFGWDLTNGAITFKVLPLIRTDETQLLKTQWASYTLIQFALQQERFTTIAIPTSERKEELLDLLTRSNIPDVTVLFGIFMYVPFRCHRGIKDQYDAEISPLTVSPFVTNKLKRLTINNVWIDRTEIICQDLQKLPLSENFHLTLSSDHLFPNNMDALANITTPSIREEINNAMKKIVSFLPGAFALLPANISTISFHLPETESIKEAVDFRNAMKEVVSFLPRTIKSVSISLAKAWTVGRNRRKNSERTYNHVPKVNLDYTLSRLTETLNEWDPERSFIRSLEEFALSRGTITIPEKDMTPTTICATKDIMRENSFSNITYYAKFIKHPSTTTSGQQGYMRLQKVKSVVTYSLNDFCTWTEYLRGDNGANVTPETGRRSNEDLSPWKNTMESKGYLMLDPRSIEWYILRERPVQINVVDCFEK